jgi:hypothetical protein
MAFLSWFCIAMLWLVSEVQAKVVFEPYGGYMSASISHVGTQTDTYQAWGLGARLMNRFPRGLFLGLDGSYFRALSYQSSDSNQAHAGNPHFYQAAIVIGAYLLRPIRIWVGYQFLDRMYLQGSQSPLNQGTSYKAGASLRISKKLNLNGEYFVGHYTQGYASTLASENGESSPLSKRLFFSLSIPLTI